VCFFVSLLTFSSQFKVGEIDEGPYRFAKALCRQASFA
jgi:hypothetical protein